MTGRRVHKWRRVDVVVDYDVDASLISFCDNSCTVIGLLNT